MRIQRLGTNFDNAIVLRMEGDPVAGKSLFRSGAGACNACHRLEGEGKEIGPALDRLSDKTWSRSELLEQIVNPSSKIHPDYKMQVILTTDGRVIQGRIVKETLDVIEVIEASGVTKSVSKDAIDERKDSGISMMPESLLASLSAKQVADLLDYIMNAQQ